MNDEIKRQKCNRCKVNMTLDKFKKKRDDNYMKRCIECNIKNVENQKKNNCEHNKKRSRCKECGGGSICEHDRIRSRCKECGGSEICIHDRIRSRCKKCKDPIKLTIRNMISCSKNNDKKYDRYDANNFIDKCFLEGIIEEYPCCYYEDCKVELQYIEYQDNLATIERLDNSIGHIKSNCVICCQRCNAMKKSDCFI